MTAEIAAILVLILVGLLIFVIDVWRWLRATGLKYVWRRFNALGLKDKAIWLAKLFLIPILLIGGVRSWWSIKGGDSIWAIFARLFDIPHIGVTAVLVLAGVLILIRLLIWESNVRLHAPKVAEVEEGTTIWDVGKVVLVPAVLSLGLLWLNVAQDNRQDRIEQSRLAERVAATNTSQRVQAMTASARQTEQFEATGTSQAIQTEVEETRVAAQSTVEANRVNADILQSYFDDMTTFVLARPITITQTEVQSLIRARTLTVLSDLDGKRNGTILRFLQELRTETGLFDLVKDDLEGINLVEADLSRADLSGANLRGADLSGAALFGAILSDANLIGANLIGARLYGADLSGADLIGADLLGANLSGANLSGADLREANLNEAALSGAILSGADLSGAILIGAALIGVDLREANLIEAKYNKEPYEDELGNTYQPTQWPDDFDPDAAGAIDVSE